MALSGSRGQQSLSVIAQVCFLYITNVSVLILVENIRIFNARAFTVKTFCMPQVLISALSLHKEKNDSLSLKTPQLQPNRLLVDCKYETALSS